VSYLAEDAHKLVEAATEAQDPLGVAWGHHYLGRAELGGEKPSAAFTYLTDALAIFSERDHEVGVGRTRALLAAVFDTVGDTDHAFENLSVAREIQSRVGDRWGEAYTVDLYGTVFWHGRRYEEAFSAFDDAEHMFGVVGDHVRAFRVRANRGRARNDLALRSGRADDHDTAAQLFRESVEDFRAIIDAGRAEDVAALRAQGHLGLGEALAGLHDHEAAVEQLVVAAALGREDRDEAVASAAEIWLARSMVGLGSHESASVLLERVAERAAEAGLESLEAEACRQRADVLELIGDLDGAYHAYRRYHHLEMARHDDHAEIRLAAAAVMFELERARLETEAAVGEVERLRHDAEERSSFIAAVAHELRNPLTAVMGFAMALESGLADTPPEEAAVMMGMIVSQARDASNIVEDLLTAAAVTRGTIQVVPKSIDLGAVVEGEVRALVGAEPFEAPPVWADPVRVRQIVRNLVSNARRYGGPTIGCRIVPAGRVVRLDVTDDGEGIPDEDVDRVFETFGRSGAGRKVSNSMGLGLPVSREMARLMGGELTYHRDGDLTVFRLELPRA
jgi:signal transduction histidine kinase